MGLGDRDPLEIGGNGGGGGGSGLGVCVCVRAVRAHLKPPKIRTMTLLSRFYGSFALSFYSVCVCTCAPVYSRGCGCLCVPISV